MNITAIPHENDILLGRGGNNNKHIGNEQLRNLARRQVEMYKTAPKKEKSKMARRLVEHIRSMRPSGRFLKRITETDHWEDVGDDSAREKTSQALRDAVAELNRGGGKSPNPKQISSLSSPPNLPQEYQQNYSNTSSLLSPPQLPQEYHQNHSNRFHEEACYGKNKRSIEEAIPYHTEYASSHPHVDVQPTKKRHSSPHTMTSMCQYEKPPPPVVTPDDPEHWREMYGNNNGVFNNHYYSHNHRRGRSTTYGSQYQYAPTQDLSSNSTGQTFSVIQERSRNSQIEDFHRSGGVGYYSTPNDGNAPPEKLDDFDLFKW
mmetsp:Transcript_25364/g.31256  ORF Transcript_25364/g.31256 Transcript_25364/m.31256 type:complete len:317 (-) Transcript_25364:666-1616(-)